MADILNKKQVLILPINKCAFSAGYKNKAYLNQQGYQHFGVDLYSTVGNQTVYACGDGVVVACGWDGVAGNERLGNVIAILYKNVYLPNVIYDRFGKKIKDKGETINLVCRMFHFDSINVKVGDKVNKDTVIGMYGNTGSTLVNGKRMGKHLHLEFDFDTNFPTLVPGVRGGGNIFNTREEINKAGGIVDSTINPSLVWTLDNNQSVKGIYSGWFDKQDIDLPLYTDTIKLVSEDNKEEKPESDNIILELEKRLKKVENNVISLRKEIEEFKKLIENIAKCF